MRRLAVRFALSHLLVAVVGGLVTYGVVRLLAPTLFDQAMRMGLGSGMPMGGQGSGPYGAQGLRASFASAVDTALLAGTLGGALLAAILGAWLASRLLRPLHRVGVAVAELARGNYSHHVPRPREPELAALATDVNALAAALGETERRRLDLLGEVAHEMRTPLTVIDGYVEGMIDGVLPKGAEQLGQVSAEVRRLRRLSDDLSALSRAQEGRLDLVLEPVDVDALVRATVDRLRPQATDAGLLLAASGTAGTVRADAGRLDQVLTNLIGNAIRATGEGGRITVTAEREDDRVIVRVVDSGIGLEAADVERVFERFYRVPGRSPSGGSGIGLTVARAYMRALGGDLTAASEGLGRGATFSGWLPASAA